MDTITLRADAVLHPGEALHFSRTVLVRKPPRQLHNHNFFELFWIQHGRARHHVNDAKQKLSEGDLLFIRPHDRHAVQGRGEETHLVNIIFPAEIIDDIEQRFGLGDRLFWSRAELPEPVRRDSRQLADLSHRALQLEAGPRTRLAAEAFLLPLLAELSGDTTELPEQVPPWLLSACSAAQSPQVFRDGAAGLVRASGRGHAHVSRSVQRFLGETPSDYVNRIRMAHAARALTGTSDGLAEIAADCGVPNLSHFHRLFRGSHGMTPKQFRTRYQKNPTQPF